MTFTVTYRGADGAVRTEAVEAASRADCFSQMRARGISPMGVKEGASHQPKHSSLKHANTSRPSTSQHLPISTIIIALVALAVIVGLLWWLLRSPGTATLPKSDVPKKPAALPKEVKPATKTTSQAVTRPTPADEPTIAPDAPHPIETYLGSEIVRRTFTTNATGFVIERIFTADGRSHRKTHYPKSPFKAATDQYIADVVSKSGGSLTPLPDLSHEKNLERDFLKSLEEPIEIEEGDSEKVRELKARVTIAREAMRRHIEGGASFAEVLENERRLSNENSDIRIDALRELDGILAQGDREGAKKYVKTVNVALQQMGIEPLKTPKELKENKP